MVGRPLVTLWQARFVLHVLRWVSLMQWQMRLHSRQPVPLHCTEGNIASCGIWTRSRVFIYVIDFVWFLRYTKLLFCCFHCSRTVFGGWIVVSTHLNCCWTVMLNLMPSHLWLSSPKCQQVPIMQTCTASIDVFCKTKKTYQPLFLGYLAFWNKTI